MGWHAGAAAPAVERAWEDEIEDEEEEGRKKRKKRKKDR